MTRDFSLSFSIFLSKFLDMAMIQFNREKYIQMAKSMGLDAALTRLHDDIREWEYEAFEGEAGYQPQMIEDLDKIRDFSRELWQIALMG